MAYNRTRQAEDLLEKNASQPPSFSVHLHPEHWTLNNVSTKFLYNTQISCLLDDIRAHRIPVDFLDLFDAVSVPFYNGCMIVELLDYRPQQRIKETTSDKPERTRVVLHPNGETLFADICSWNRKYGNKWSDRDALEVEARLLLATSPPLCLAPDPHLTRVANHVLRVSTPTVPISLKRKAAVMDPEEDEIEKLAEPRSCTNQVHSYRILDVTQRRPPRDHKPPTPVGTAAEPAPQPSNMGSYASEKLKKQTRPGTPKMFSNGSTHTSATQTPSPTHMFANTQPVPSSMDSKRAPTPQHPQYAPSPPSVPPSHTSESPIPSSFRRPSFQPPIPNAQFLNPPPPGRNTNGQAKTLHPNKPPQPTAPQTTQMYFAQQQQALMMQHRLAAQQQQQQQQQHQQPPQQQPPQPQQPPQNGRSTPRPAMNNGQANLAAAMAASRGSPLAPNQRLGTRSPANQNQAPPPNPQMPAHNHPPPQLNFSYHHSLIFDPAPPTAMLPLRVGSPYRCPNHHSSLSSSSIRCTTRTGWPMMVPGRGGMTGANGHGPGMQMSMPMQPIMPGGQPHTLQHHQVPVGGGGKGQPGLPGR
ncbi:Spt20 family-domain-containing protein [Mycena galopus ATCC 62051]|nr:Spt20 family-domain-containing protein [Mycena galopus ATCC 62051]